jgi:DNA-binding transcriptional regulator YhcF (GntR family)
MTQWNDTQPIFLQIRQQIIERILGGAIGEGEAVPSIRQVASDLNVNPLTVTRAYQSLVDTGVVEKKRGLGMYVAKGARAELLKREREKFLDEDWPAIAQRIRALGLEFADLIGKETDK